MNAHSPGPWALATSNSWRRIVDAQGYPVCEPIVHNDGHPDLHFPNGGPEGVDAALLITGPELLFAATTAAGALQGAAQGLRELGHPKAAAALDEALAPLLVAMVKASKGPT